MSFWENTLFSGNCVLTSENCLDGKLSASSLTQRVVTQQHLSETLCTVARGPSHSKM